MAYKEPARAGWLAAAMMLSVASPAMAEPEDAAAGRAMAPIIYATPKSDARVMRHEIGVRLENSAADRSFAQAPLVMAAVDTAAPLVPASVASARAARSPNTSDGFSSAGAVDLRPGASSSAARPERASFGPAVSALAPKADGAATALQSRPLARAAELADPVAGPPYQVDGKWYVPMHEPDYDEVGLASWYGPTFHGKASATGEQFDEMAMTAAHPTLPIPSLVRVTNLENGKSVVVRLNDRGPFVDDRIIDLSKGAAEALQMKGKGTAKVRVQFAGPAPRESNAVPANVAYATGDAVAVSPPTQASPAFDTRALAPVPEVRPLASAPAAGRATAQTQAQAQADGSAPGFYLQAGSFADLGNAHKLRDRMRATFVNDAPVFVTPVQVDGAEFYRVMLGPWPSRDAVVRAQAGVSEAGGKSIIVARAR